MNDKPMLCSVGVPSDFSPDAQILVAFEMHASSGLTLWSNFSITINCVYRSVPIFGQALCVF